MTRQTDAKLLITPTVWRNFDYAAMAESVRGETGCDVLCIEQGVLPEAESSVLPSPPTDVGDVIRHIYYSSGTTADPKGGCHTDRSVMAAATGLLCGPQLAEHDCVPVPYPYTHIGGIALTVACLMAGFRMLLLESFDPVSSPPIMSEHGASILGSAVPFFHAYIEAQRVHGTEPLFPQLRAFTSGGAPKPPELHFELKELFGLGIMSGWGMTEFPIATFTTLDDSDEDLAHTEGRPVPGVELRVVAADGSDLPAGEEGELRVRGPQMIRGYVDARLDANAFDEHGYLCTGDLGVIGPRGHVRITGRLKDVIIRNAENISALEIEGVLYAHLKIADVAVIGIPDPRTGEQACAVVVLAPAATSLTVAEMNGFCREQGLAAQKIPERVEIVEELPRNSLGKVLKQELRTTYRP